MKTMVSGKGQVVIPKPIRQAVNMQQGDLLDVELEGKVIVLKPLKRFQAERWQDYIGIGEGIVDDYLQDKKQERRKEDVYP
jgi:AbrB family looped-hinge helix DNA binding protein